ncbi:MAG: aconitase X catalytic domain-containing protein [Methanothermobacter tenebrarum]|nr:aconitase X catalytic domain-containing protein [Methanothermobacter sp.]HOQ19654.1 aconitase X catalytic domain-containing protein [Methanothermobacter sp.]
MYLTAYEEEMYDGEYGEAVEKSMKILVALGDIYGAERMVEISSAQISGVSYKTIGDAGLEYLEELSKDPSARVKVQSSLNPAGMDLDNWRELGFSREFADRQSRIIDAYMRMDVMNTCTCTPYLIGNIPTRGSHVAWSESSAVIYANSILGARTNREGGPSALAAAICGRTPAYGYHLDENRIANILVKVEDSLEGYEYGVLGYYVGKIVGDGVPSFRFRGQPSGDEFKSLGAALASSGAVALYYVEGLNPAVECEFEDRISVDSASLEDSMDELSTTNDKPDLICVGCPHCSLGEIRLLARYLRRRRLSCDFWVCTSHALKVAADRMGYSDLIVGSGGVMVSDTCMVVSPIEDLGFDVVGVDSAKAANYIPSMCGLDVVFDDWKNLVRL